MFILSTLRERIPLEWRRQLHQRLHRLRHSVRLGTLHNIWGKDHGTPIHQYRELEADSVHCLVLSTVRAVK